MAFANKIIRNTQTGQQIRFIQTAADTSGALLEMETTYQPSRHEPPVHYHPVQSEHFTVVSGQLTVNLEGKIKILNRGDILHIPPRTVHSMWNESGRVTVVNWKVRPALNTELFLETMIGLANDGKTDATGKPALLQLTATANRYSRVFRLGRPPFFLQRMLFALLLPFSCIFGYRADYQKYFN